MERPSAASAPRGGTSPREEVASTRSAVHRQVRERRRGILSTISSVIARRRRGDIDSGLKRRTKQKTTMMYRR